jgi:tetratricopeptide (TPR) repeat protein
VSPGSRMTEPAPPPDFDANSPLAKVIVGIAEIFYAGEGESAPERHPAELKAAVEKLIETVVPAPPRVSLKPPEQLAQESVAAAWDALEAGAENAEDLALMALRYWPNCADAYTLLGISAGEQLEIAMPLFTLAVMAGADALGPGGFERFAGRFWEAPETRPFMGALGFLARANRDAGAIDAAAAHFIEMLNLNPNDDQGARYDLLALSLQIGRTEVAERIFKAFADDEGTAFAYAKALYYFQKGGDNDPARLALRAAQKANPIVAEYLIGTRKPPEELPSLGEPGGEGEAILYLDLMGTAWTATKDAIDWVRKHTVVTVKGPPVKERRAGPREV